MDRKPAGVFGRLAFYLDPAISVGVKGKTALTAYFRKLLTHNPGWVWTQVQGIPLEDGFLNKWRARIPVEGIRMILDILENVHRYAVMNRGFAKAMAFLLRLDLKELPVGKHEIDGERVYAMVSKDTGQKRADALLETHEKYIDIQLILAGTDDIGWKPKSMCKQPSGEYDHKSDLQFFRDQPNTWLSIVSGEFAIFFPEDAHMPLISSGRIHKVVVKVVAT